MEITSAIFLANLRKQFEGESPSDIQLATVIRDLGTWTSMQALIVMASLDWDYGVMIEPEEMRAAQTVQDLYDLVLAKKG